MLKQDLNEIRSLKRDELDSKLKDLEKEAFQLRFQNKTMRLNDVSQIKKVLHKIAFVKMLQTQIAMSEEVIDG